MADMPPLPPGFQLESAPTSLPPLPEGFQLESSGPAKSSGGGKYVTGLLRAAASGATLNFSDEIEALVRSGVYGENRKMALAKIRDEMDEFAKEHPYVATGANIAGAMAVPGMAGARALGAAARAGATSLGARVAVGAGLGAAEGAVSGYGASEADKGDAGSHTLGSAVVGGALGGAIPIAGEIIKPVAQAIGSRLPVVGQHIAEARARSDLRRAIEHEADLTGTTAQNIIDDMRATSVATQQRGAPRRNMASILTEGGESVQGMAKEAAKEAAVPQRLARDYIEAIDNARPGTRQYHALYRGRDIQSPVIARMVQTHPDVQDALIHSVQELERRNATRAERAARNPRYRGLPSRPPPQVPGVYTPEQLHLMDQWFIQEIQIAEKAGQGGRATTLRDLQDLWRQELYQRSRALRTITEEYARGSQQLRDADVSSAVPVPDRHGGLRDMLGDAAAMMTGHSTPGMRRIGKLIEGGSPQRAEAFMRLVTTRFRDRQAIERVFQALERMEPAQRNRYVNAVLATAGAEAGDTDPLGIH